MPYKSAASSPTRELTPSIRAQLLDARVWQPILEKYTTAVNLSVTWIDRDKHCGPIVNARPNWSLVSAKAPSSTDDCGFSLFSPQTCNCVADAFKKGDIVFVRDRVRLTHFAIPLVLNEQRVGTLIGGQVFDQYPDQLALGHIAHTAGISSEEIWKVARLEHPVKRATLQLYADLLWVLGENILQAQH
ncbi:MAG: PocR ligand-binding domain-containing protein [Nitrospiraceae bacterium]|nr:PocR ligand-binding domain-containing protein [Nitrospiraceae bacterium]